MGYSPMSVGYLYTYLSILAFLVKPISGIIVDKFRVKRIMFLSFVLTCGLTAYALNFIQKLPTENVAILSCNNTTVLDVCSNVDGQLPQCDDGLYKLLTNNFESITCQVRNNLLKQKQNRRLGNINMVFYVFLKLTTAVISLLAFNSLLRLVSNNIDILILYRCP